VQLVVIAFQSGIVERQRPIISPRTVARSGPRVLDAIPVRVASGADDPFHPGVMALANALPAWAWDVYLDIS
jgi:hypothetical protein